ncbi:MAG: hypothetical protein JO255_20890 [Alphaproteobacteria bacterium]|nr:hypothetical protein [Alphaproteobacteria bacterium]
MACLCKNQLAALTDPSFTSSLSATEQLGATLPPLPKLPLSLMLNEGAAAPSSSTASLSGLNIPNIPLLAALPQLSSIAAASVTSTRLGLPLPGSLPQLSTMMGNFNPSVLSPLMSLNLGALLNLNAYAALALKLRMMFNVNPWDADLSGPLASRLSASLAPGGGLNLALNAPTPALPPVTLGTLQQLGSLIHVAFSLGVNLATSGGIASLAMALGPLANIALPSLNIAPELLARVNALATINDAFGLGPDAAARLPSMIASLNALLALKLPFPSVQAQLGMPSSPQMSSILGLNLPQLASVNWNVPAMPSLMAALPSLSLMAKLNGILPMINLKPCASSCPLAAA